MKARVALLIGVAVLSSMLETDCGGSGLGASMPPGPPRKPVPPVTQELSTAAVRAIVETQTSETGEPLQVNGAAVALTPIGDETGSPIDVDGA